MARSFVWLLICYCYLQVKFEIWDIDVFVDYMSWCVDNKTEYLALKALFPIIEYHTSKLGAWFLFSPCKSSITLHAELLNGFIVFYWNPIEIDSWAVLLFHCESYVNRSYQFLMYVDMIEDFVIHSLGIY